MLAETLRQTLPEEDGEALKPSDWDILPEGPEKESLMQYARVMQTALSPGTDIQ